MFDTFFTQVKGFLLPEKSELALAGQGLGLKEATVAVVLYRMNKKINGQQHNACAVPGTAI